ncbi:hypothetical protein PG993_001435 [Apiospora rasikravindrae]|uniref:Uncharacterized protein n=1 Tax=Apiospora rasikravindrae TaxID=990691 RepID=A0ABR1UE41_9PEZI
MPSSSVPTIPSAGRRGDDPLTPTPTLPYPDRQTYRPTRRPSDSSSISSASSSSGSWKCPRSICAMSPASEAYSPPSPPSVSPVTAHRTKRTISPGVYICKGEGHSVRHSWIIDGRLVEFPFAVATHIRDTYGHKTAGLGARPVSTGSVGGGRSVQPSRGALDAAESRSLR